MISIKHQKMILILKEESQEIFQIGKKSQNISLNLNKKKINQIQWSLYDLSINLLIVYTI